MINNSAREIYFFRGGDYPLKVCNRTRLEVKCLRKNTVEATILTEYAKG
jgi:hypothetical protein